jgi:hypothetical protein
MKKYLLLLLMVLPVLQSVGQWTPYKDFGDTIGPVTVISFEEPTSYVTILPLQNNIWQIGAPHKIFFDAAYSLPNAIVTDTMNDYPLNNFSSFELIAGQFNVSGYPWNLFIDFRHKFDSDTLHDGGYITISWDNGVTWTNIIDDTLSPWGFNPHNYMPPFGNKNLYSNTAYLVNGQQGWSGNSGNWIHTSLGWWDMPTKKTGGFPDTVRLRFNFISDNIPHNREGWMIDQIKLYSIDVGSGIREYMKGKPNSWFSPNPITTTATFTLNRTYLDVHYELMDARGLLISKSDRGTCDKFTFNRSNLTPGIYFMRLFLNDQVMDIHRLVIL